MGCLPSTKVSRHGLFSTKIVYIQNYVAINLLISRTSDIYVNALFHELIKDENSLSGKSNLPPCKLFKYYVNGETRIKKLNTTPGEL